MLWRRDIQKARTVTGGYTAVAHGGVTVGFGGGSRLSHSFALPLPRYAGEGNTKVRRSISTRGEIARESNREIGAGSLPRENGEPVVLEIIQGTVASVLSSA